SGKATVPDLRGEVIASDNCNDQSGLTITQSPPPGMIIGLGATPVAITVMDPAGNSSSCISTVTVSFPLKDFVVFSQEFTQLKSGAKVFSGDVGANARLTSAVAKVPVEIEIDDSAQMLQAGSKVVGDTLSLGVKAQVFNVFCNQMLNNGGPILGSLNKPLPLPVLDLPLIPGKVLVGATDVVVSKGKQALPPGVYRNITLLAGATLILGPGEYDISNLNVGGNAK